MNAALLISHTFNSHTINKKTAEQKVNKAGSPPYSFRQHFKILKLTAVLFGIILLR